MPYKMYINISFCLMQGFGQWVYELFFGGWLVNLHSLSTACLGLSTTEDWLHSSVV